MKLYSYKNVFDIETKIYSIQNIRLPVPIKPIELGYFAVFFMLFYILSLIVPMLGSIPAIFRVFLIPFLLMKFFVKKKLDGKKPQKFFVSYVAYLATRLQLTEFFRKTGRPKEAYKIKWRCNCRNVM